MLALNINYEMKTYDFGGLLTLLGKGLCWYSIGEALAALM